MSEYCPGSAHENPFQDFCGLCAPSWGQGKVTKPKPKEKGKETKPEPSKK